MRGMSHTYRSECKKLKRNYSESEETERKYGGRYIQRIADRNF